MLVRVCVCVNEKLQGQGKKGKLAGFRQCSLNEAAGAETK